MKRLITYQLFILYAPAVWDALRELGGSGLAKERDANLRPWPHVSTGAPMMRRRQHHPMEAKNACPAQCAFKLSWRDLEGQKPPIESGGRKGFFQHVLRRIGGHGVAHQATDILLRLVGQREL